MKKRLARRKKMYFAVIFVEEVGDGEVRTGGCIHRCFQIWKSLHWRFWFMDIVAVLMDFQRFGEDRWRNGCQCFETICMQKKKKRRKSICHWCCGSRYIGTTTYADDTCVFRLSLCI